jgi:hypothetical protein
MNSQPYGATEVKYYLADKKYLLGRPAMVFAPVLEIGAQHFRVEADGRGP